jgi:hypothetical protein
VNSPHFGRGQEYIFGFFFVEKMGNGRLITQVEFTAAAENEIVVAALTECTQQCATDHSVMTGYVDSRIDVHGK